MSTIRLSKKIFLGIIAGFVIIILIGIVTSAISFYISTNIARTSSPQDFKSAFTQQPYVTFSWLLRIISFISPVIGGFVVGWIIKKKGLLYGGVLGIVLKLISIAIVSLTFLLPTSLIYGPNFATEQGRALIEQREILAQKNIVNQLLYSPFTIALTAFGGYLGERFSKKSSKKK